MEIHCPTCNRSSNDIRFIGEFCEFCVAGKLKKVVPDKVTIERCGRCGNFRIQGQSRHFSNATLGEAITAESHMPGCVAKVASYHVNSAMVDFTCETENGEVKFEKLVMVDTTLKTCQRCYRMSSGYYEALVQFRGGEDPRLFRKDDKERVAKFTEKLTELVIKKGAFISKTEKVPNGIDLYVSDKDLVNEFFALRKLKPKKSFTLHGIKAGKRIYRNTYMFRVS